MSILAKRLSTCVPPEVVTSPRRASFSACEGAASLLQPDTPASPFLKHASFHLLRSPVQLLPVKSTCTSGHRASVGPSDLLLEQPSASYLRRKRTSLDPSWLSSSLNYQDESIRSPMGAAGHHGSPNLECKKPVPLYIPDGDSTSPSQSFIRASEPQNVLPVSPRNQITPNAYRRNTFHHLLETIPTPPSLRRRTCSTHIISPAADFLCSSLITENCVRRSPFNTCRHLSPCFELSPPNTHFNFNPCDREGGKEEDLEDTGNGMLGLKGRALSVDHGGRRLEVPRIALNSPETSLAVSCKSPALDPSPSSLGLSPKIAALYHLQHHTLATPHPPGVAEGRVGLRAAPRCSLAVEQPTSVGPGLSSRRASWHVSDGGHPDPWVKAHLSNLHSTRYSSVIAFLDHRRECQSVDVTPRVGRVMGRGGFGTVKVGCHRGVKVAIKVLRGTRAATSSRREAHALLLTPHAHLASTHALVTPTLTTGEACITWATAYLKDRQEKKQIVPREVAASMFSLGPDDASGCRVGEEGDECWGRPGWAWVVSELCTPHSLLTLLNESDLELSIGAKIRYTSELASGLAYLHSHDLVHLDVKPANALLTRHGHLKLADFGCCARIDHNEDPVLGTVVYQAPEVLRGGAAGPHSDVFSLGVTIWHMLTRSAPYQGIHPHVVLFQVVHLRHRPTDHHPQESTHTTTTLEALLWHLARSCWAEEPEDRPAVSDLCRTLNAMIMLYPEGGRMFGL